MVPEQNSSDLGVDQYRDYLHLLARLQLDAQLRGQIDPSDIVQQTLIKAHQKRDQFQGQTEAELAAWLRRILCNTLIDAIRQHQRQGKVVRSLEVSVEESSARLEAWLAASGDSPREQVIRQEQLVHLAQALGQLPDDQRLAVEQHYLQEEPIAVIAETMQRSEASVAGLLRRGLKNLRQLLGKTS